MRLRVPPQYHLPRRRFSCVNAFSVNPDSHDFSPSHHTCHRNSIASSENKMTIRDAKTFIPSLLSTFISSSHFDSWYRIASHRIISLRKCNSSYHVNDKHPAGGCFCSLITLAPRRLRALDYSQQPTPFGILFPRALALLMRGGLLSLHLRTLRRPHQRATGPHPRIVDRHGTAQVQTEVL